MPSSSAQPRLLILYGRPVLIGLSSLLAVLLIVCAGLLTGLSQPASPAAAEGPEDLSDSFYLPIRYRTQFDGTPYAGGNCGPAVLGMILSAFRDEYVETTDLRAAVNVMQGTEGNYDSGTSLEVMAALGRRYGAIPVGLFDGPNYRQWTLDEVRAHLRAGYPVVPQVRYVKLPGHEWQNVDFDHYIVLIGLSGENFVYHDPAFKEYGGQSLVITPEDLRRAWAAGLFGFAAVAFQPGSTLPSLLSTPTPTPAPPTPVPPTSTATPRPATPGPGPAALTATPVAPLPAAALTTDGTASAPPPSSPSLIGRLFGQTGADLAAPSSPTVSPTPDQSARPIGGSRADRPPAPSVRGEARPTTSPAEGEPGVLVAALAAPSLPPAAGLVLSLLAAHLIRARLAESRPKGDSRP